MENRIIKRVAAGDGNHIADTIVAASEQIPTSTLDRDLTNLPDEHLTAVLVFLLTKESFNDSKVLAFARRAESGGFPILPLIPKRAAFDFRSLTRGLAYLGRLNAVGWDEGDRPGEQVFTAIRQHLGLEPFRRDCQLFISYRRSDGGDVTQAIHQHFQGFGYDAFLDTEDEAIAPGEEVQPRIAQAIPERDFLLLIDSPDAADSEWVREKVTIALENRVALFSVRVGGTDGFPQVRGLPSIEWHDDIDSNLRTLERYVALTLATRRSFDRRLRQTLDTSSSSSSHCGSETGESAGCCCASVRAQVRSLACWTSRMRAMTSQGSIASRAAALLSRGGLITACSSIADADSPPKSARRWIGRGGPSRCKFWRWTKS